MAVNESITDSYTTVAASNTPAGSDSIGSDLDDHLRDMKKNIKVVFDVAEAASASAARNTSAVTTVIDAWGYGGLNLSESTLAGSATVSSGQALILTQYDQTAMGVPVDCVCSPTAGTLILNPGIWNVVVTVAARVTASATADKGFDAFVRQTGGTIIQSLRMYANIPASGTRVGGVINACISATVTKTIEVALLSYGEAIVVNNLDALEFLAFKKDQPSIT